jgi:hypothetical protein
MSFNLAKSIFGASWGKLLGHIFKDSNISIDLERVCVIQKIPPPATKKDMQSFMGKINFVRRFIHEFSIMVKPIHNLNKKEHDLRVKYSKWVSNLILIHKMNGYI